MNAFVSRGIITLAITGGLLVLGAGAAHADDGTDGDGGLLSGLQGVLNVDLPITVSGNGISVAGDSSSSGSSGSGSSGGSAPGGSTSGGDSLLGGTQGLVGTERAGHGVGQRHLAAGRQLQRGARPSRDRRARGDASTGTTSGKDGILGGTQAVGGVDAPVTVSGNAISVLGDSSSSGSATAAGTSGSGSSSGSTSGEDSVVGGTQVLADAGVPIVVGGQRDQRARRLGEQRRAGDRRNRGGARALSPPPPTAPTGVASGSQVILNPAAPVTAGGNAISVVGDSSSNGAVVGSPSTGGTTTGTTTGDGGTLGGTQVLLGGDRPGDRGRQRHLGDRRQHRRRRRPAGRGGWRDPPPRRRPATPAPPGA